MVHWLALALCDRTRFAMITTNLLYYVISVSGWGVALLAICCFVEVGIFFAVPLWIWYAYVLIWSASQGSVVYDDDWANAAAKADTASDWAYIHKYMMWMYWLRMISFILCCCMCLCLGCVISTFVATRGNASGGGK